MRLILGIRQAEPDDTLNDMKNRGLEFEVISSETDFEDAHTEVSQILISPPKRFPTNGAFSRCAWPGPVHPK